MSATAKSSKTLGQCAQFVKNAKNFARVCRKPSKKETIELFKGYFLGLCILGVSAYIVKVIHIPINNIIAGSDS